jgi:NTP pyrophosphatase (non-canonical NTP hydrolase)
MPLDDEITVGRLRQAVADFTDAREWRPFHSPKNLSMSIAIEAAELMERFQWLSLSEAEEAVTDSVEKAAVAEELADVLVYCLSLCNVLEVDLSTAVLGKLQTNEARYPAAEFRGRYRRPNRQKRD